MTPYESETIGVATRGLAASSGHQHQSDLRPSLSQEALTTQCLMPHFATDSTLTQTAHGRRAKEQQSANSQVLNRKLESPRQMGGVRAT